MSKKVDMHVHEKKKSVDGCMSMKKGGRTKKRNGWMHVHEKKGGPKKNDGKETLSHVEKSTTQSRRTKYLKNGTLIEDYNAS